MAKQAAPGVIRDRALEEGGRAVSRNKARMNAHGRTAVLKCAQNAHAGGYGISMMRSRKTDSSTYCSLMPYGYIITTAFINFVIYASVYIHV